MDRRIAIVILFVLGMLIGNILPLPAQQKSPRYQQWKVADGLWVIKTPDGACVYWSASGALTSYWDYHVSAQC